jgi:hypothetical protein
VIGRSWTVYVNRGDLDSLKTLDLGSLCCWDFWERWTLFLCLFVCSFWIMVQSQRNPSRSALTGICTLCGFVQYVDLGSSITGTGLIGRMELLHGSSLLFGLKHFNYSFALYVFGLDFYVLLDLGYGTLVFHV